MQATHEFMSAQGKKILLGFQKGRFSAPKQRQNGKVRSMRCLGGRPKETGKGCASVSLLRG